MDTQNALRSIATGLIIVALGAGATMARSVYQKYTSVSEEEARLYRAVPFEWAVTGKGGTVKGRSTAFVRLSPAGEWFELCGWLEPGPDEAATRRAERWLSQASLVVGQARPGAWFIGAAEGQPGKGLRALCVLIKPGPKYDADVPFRFEGKQVEEF